MYTYVKLLMLLAMLWLVAVSFYIFSSSGSKINLSLLAGKKRKVIESQFANKNAPSTNTANETINAITKQQENIRKTLHQTIFPYTHNEFDFCGDGKLSLLIGVCSAVENYARRKAIRLTWGQWAANTKYSLSVKILFLMGSSEDPVLSQMVNAESEYYRDIVQENFLDTYDNLTLKTMMLMRWTQNYCSNADYVMKTDDDMFVNIPNLLNFLNASHKPSHLFGCKIHHAVPEKSLSHKHYRHGFRERYYPDYLSGTGYVMSKGVVRRLYLSAKKLDFFHVEDVFLTGMSAKLGGISPENHAGFQLIRRPLNVCLFRTIITAHQISPSNNYYMWKKLLLPTECQSAVAAAAAALLPKLSICLTLFIVSSLIVIIFFARRPQ